VRLISPLGDGVGEPSEAPSEAARAAALSKWQADAATPPPSLALSMFGMFLHLRGNYDDAMACYDRALELQPTAIDVLLKRSSLWFEKEQPAKSHDDFTRALEIDRAHADIYCHRGQLHMLQEKLDKAVADLKRSVELDGGSILARIQLGMAHHRSKTVTEARSTFQQAEAAFPDSPDALNYYGEFLVEMGELDGAEAKFEKALEVSKGSYALAHINVGVLKLHRHQDIPGAMEQCKKAISVDPLCESAHVQLAQLHLHAQDQAAAVAAFDDALALLRVKQELVEACKMREIVAAQLSLLTQNPKLYQPALDRQRMEAMQMMGAA